MTNARVVLPQDSRRRISTPARTPKGETGGESRLEPAETYTRPAGPSESKDCDSSRRPVKASRDPMRSTFPPRLPEGCQGFWIECLETRGPFCSECSARSPRRVIEHRRTEFRAQETPQHVALRPGTTTKGCRLQQRNRAPSPLEETISTLRSIYRAPKNTVERTRGFV